METGGADLGRIPTTEGWVTLPGGGIVPANRARETGWGDDRDAVNTARIEAARQAMADAVTAYHVAYGKLTVAEIFGDMGEAMVGVIAKAEAVVKAWAEFEEATR